MEPKELATVASPQPIYCTNIPHVVMAVCVQTMCIALMLKDFFSKHILP